jgi:S1-C subfamily serine protease
VGVYLFNKLRDYNFLAVLLCFGLFGCATAEQVRNDYSKLHSENLISEENIYGDGFAALNDLPIPSKFRASNPNYMHCDEKRWDLINQHPAEIRRACAKILDSNNVINVVKNLINAPIKLSNGTEIHPAKKYSKYHEMEVEIIVNNFTRDYGSFPPTMSTYVDATIILRSEKDGFEVSGNGSKAISNVRLGTLLTAEAYGRVAYLLALNGALYKSLGNAYSNLPENINHYLVAGKGSEDADNSSNIPEIANAGDNGTEVPDNETNPQASSGSGFFVSKMGHVVTNAHVVNDCSKLTIGDNANNQTSVELISTDKRNDLALLKPSTLSMTSKETKSLISKLEIRLVPLAGDGLLRSNDVELGEKVMVAGYPYGDMYSNTIKVTRGIVSAVRGMGDDSGQFQMDAAAQAGNSGGPIYDESGNIVGVVVAQLNKLQVAKAMGSLPENVNFGIKASTVRQFLTSSGLPTKWSEREDILSTKELAKTAQQQTLMVMCLQ